MGLRRMLALAALPALAGCVTIGRDFPAGAVRSLEVGATTQDEARRAFGPPWRTGLEDGRRTWTYGHYRYALLGSQRARDLVLEWDERGVLASYTYNSTEHDL